jgi:hypothetical protein
MIRNEIPCVLVFHEGYGTDIRVLLFRWIVQKGIPRFLSSEEWFGTKFRAFVFHERHGTEFRVFLCRWIVQNGIPRFLSSEEWFGTKFRAFSLPRNRRSSNGKI